MFKVSQLVHNGKFPKYLTIYLMWQPVLIHMSQGSAEIECIISQLENTKVVGPTVSHAIYLKC